MLAVVGYGSVDELVAAAIPDSIQAFDTLNLPIASSEPQVLAELRGLAARNRRIASMIGLGYAETITPPVDPAQRVGEPRLVHRVHAVPAGDLPGPARSAAQLSDHDRRPHRAADGRMHRCSTKPPPQPKRWLWRGGRPRRPATRFVVDIDVHPQTLAVLRTRAVPLGIELVVADVADGLPEGELFGVLLQYPGSTGARPRPVCRDRAAHERRALVTVAADLLGAGAAACRPERSVPTSPSARPSDSACRSASAGHTPLSSPYGRGCERSLPGRLVGVSVDADGRPAYRLALQTREQHIRREKATSNICTAQVLLAVMASMYAVYHGPEGLRAIALRVHRYATLLAAGLRDSGVERRPRRVLRHRHARACPVVPPRSSPLLATTASTCDSSTTTSSVSAATRRRDAEHRASRVAAPSVWTARTSTSSTPTTDSALPDPLLRTDEYPDPPGVPQPPLRDRDAALPAAAIRQGRRARPLDDPARLLHDEAQRAPPRWSRSRWPEFADIHPFAPIEQAAATSS